SDTEEPKSINSPLSEIFPDAPSISTSVDPALIETLLLLPSIVQVTPPEVEIKTLSFLPSLVILSPDLNVVIFCSELNHSSLITGSDPGVNLPSLVEPPFIVVIYSPLLFIFLTSPLNSSSSLGPSDLVAPTLL